MPILRDSMIETKEYFVKNITKIIVATIVLSGVITTILQYRFEHTPVSNLTLFSLIISFPLCFFLINVKLNKKKGK